MKSLKEIVIANIKGAVNLAYYDDAKLNVTREKLEQMLEQHPETVKRFGFKFDAMPLKIKDLYRVRKDYTEADQFLVCLKNYYAHENLKEASLLRMKQIMVNNYAPVGESLVNKDVDSYIKKIRKVYAPGLVLSLIGSFTITPLILPFALAFMAVGVTTEISSVNYNKTEKRMNVVLEELNDIKKGIEDVDINELRRVLDENKAEIVGYLR